MRVHGQLVLLPNGLCRRGPGFPLGILSRFTGSEGKPEANFSRVSVRSFHLFDLPIFVRGAHREKSGPVGRKADTEALHRVEVYAVHLKGRRDAQKFVRKQTKNSSS